MVMRTHPTILTISRQLIVRRYATCKKIAWTKFVPFCDGISGINGDLKIDDTFRYESVMLPIDTLVIDLTNRVKDDDMIFAKNCIKQQREMIKKHSLILYD